MRSYPTYEEWKRQNSDNNKFHALSSYPTYEEWKPIILFFLTFVISVLILPMRNGNNIFSIILYRIPSSSYPTYEEWKLTTSSLKEEP